MFFKLTIAAVIVIATIVGLALFQRHLRGQEGGLFPGLAKRREPKSRSNELEAFIAAYRRDKSVIGQAAKPAAPTAASAEPAAGAGPAPPQAKAPGGFLQGPAKVLYLVLKAALPDHHIFVYTRLADVIKPIGKPLTPQGRAQFAQSRMDFVVCNKDLAVVALLDISDGTRADDPIKQHLQPQLSTAGIRYLRVAPTAIPKPAEVRALILGG
jgi:hypothetical protein